MKCANKLMDTPHAFRFCKQVFTSSKSRGISDQYSLDVTPHNDESHSCLDITLADALKQRTTSELQSFYENNLSKFTI